MDPATEFTAAMRKTAARIRKAPLFAEHIWRNDPIHQYPEPEPWNGHAFKRVHVTASPEPPEPAAASQSQPSGSSAPALPAPRG